MEEDEAAADHEDARDVLGRVLAVLGLIVHGIVGLVYFAAAGLIAPLYGIIVLAIGWSLLLLLAIRWWSRRPRLIILVPFVAMLWWFAIVSLGSRYLGWTA